MKFVLAIPLALVLSSCSILGGDEQPVDVGIYSRVYAMTQADDFPVAMVAISSTGVFAFGDAEAVAELYNRAGGDLREPWAHGADRAVWRPWEGADWEGDVGARAFPTECAFAFRYDEAARWGVTFFDLGSSEQ